MELGRIASREILALRTLWREPAAGQVFRELENTATSAGRVLDILGGGWPNLLRDSGGWGKVRDEDYSTGGD